MSPSGVHGAQQLLTHWKPSSEHLSGSVQQTGRHASGRVRSVRGGQCAGSSSFAQPLKQPGTLAPSNDWSIQNGATCWTSSGILAYRCVVGDVEGAVGS